MKSVLISIQPYWVFLIVAKAMGWNYPQEKTVEVRKNFPKDEDWNRVVEIYCTKDRTSFNQIPKEFQPLMEKFLGKVVGKFTCDKIIEIVWSVEEGVYFDGELQDGFEPNGKGNNPTCLSFVELEDYLPDNEGYGWHVSNLMVYNKPKGLGEFSALNSWHRKSKKHPCIGCWDCEIKRPPQSWCYILESEVKKHV